MPRKLTKRSILRVCIGLRGTNRFEPQGHRDHQASAQGQAPRPAALHHRHQQRTACRRPAKAHGWAGLAYEARPVHFGKTGKINVLMMNRSTYNVLQRYLDYLSQSDEDFLFKPAKEKKRPLTTS